MRKQTLDLAQQAQVAACLYLGFDPHEIKYNQHVWHKSLEAQYQRPLELHLHHHHHHHVDKYARRRELDVNEPRVGTAEVCSQRKKSGSISDNSRSEFYVEENRSHQEMIVRSHMEPKTWSNSYYSNRYLSHARGEQACGDVSSDFVRQDVPSCDLGRHCYMSTSKSERRVATSVKRKKISGEEVCKNDTVPFAARHSNAPQPCESEVKPSEKHLDNGLLDVRNHYNNNLAWNSSPTCSPTQEQRHDNVGQFVLRRTNHTMMIRDNSLFAHDPVFVQDEMRDSKIPSQPGVANSLHDKFEELVEGKQETVKLQKLLAQEKIKGEAYNNQLLQVQQRYRALSEELHDMKTELPSNELSASSRGQSETNSSFAANDSCEVNTLANCGVNAKDETMGNSNREANTRDQTLQAGRQCFSPHSAKAFTSTHKLNDLDKGRSTTQESQAYENGENDLNDLLRNFSRLLDKKLKEDMFVKVTKAIACVLEDRSSPETTINAEHKSGCHRASPLMAANTSCHDDLEPERCSTVETSPGKQFSSLNGYANVYLCPVFEDQKRCADREAKTEVPCPNKDQSLPNHTTKVDNSFLVTKQAELRNLEAAVENLGAICQEQKEKLEQCNLGEEQHDVKHVREHYLTILKEIGKHVNQLHCDLEEEKQDPPALDNFKSRDDREERETELSEEMKLKETALHRAEALNQQLANEMSKTETALSLLRSHCTDLQSSLEAELEETKNEIQVLQSAVVNLKEQLTRSESKATALEQCLEAKDCEMQDIKAKVCSIQKEADDALLEKYELVKRVHEVKKDADDHKQRIDDLVGINDELLNFAQAKEAELTSLKNQMRAVQEENTRLNAEFQSCHEELKVKDDAVNQESDLLRTKLDETEYELSQREEALNRLSSQLSSAIESQDSYAEELQQLRTLLSKAEIQEGLKEEQLRQSRITIQGLESKLLKMETEMRETKSLDGFKSSEGKRCDEVFDMWQSSDMRWKVQQLEEEIMEKEGQIAILRSSFPEEYDSIF